MQISRSHVLLYASLVFCSSIALAAEEHSPGETIEPVSDLSLRDVVASALERDTRLPLTHVFQAQGKAYGATSSRPFSGPGSVQLRHQTDIFLAGRGVREWEASVEVPLWHAKQRDAASAVGASFEGYSEQYEAQIKLEVAGLVRQSIWDLALAEQRSKLAKQALDDAKELEREVAARVRAGDLSQNDLLLARDESLTKEYELVAVRVEYVHAGERYEALTGLSQRPEKITEKLSEHVSLGGGHPFLREMDRRIERARAQLELSRRSRGGPLYLTVGVRNDKASSAETSNTSVGLGIRVPFDAVTFQQPQLASAEAAIAELASERARLERQLLLDHHEAEHEIETAHLQSEISIEQNKVVQESLQKMRAAFKAGELDLNQLIRAQARAQAAERQLQLRRLEEQQAYAKFNQALGELP